MASPKWEGENLWYLLNLSLKELRQKYPQEKYNTLKGKRGYWKKQIQEGKMQMPPQPEREPTLEDRAGRLTKTWEVSAFNRETQEWETAVNHAYAFGEDQLDDFEPAAPAKITPSRRKAPNREYRTLFVFSDAQIDYRRLDDGSLEPLHDERAMRVARLICRDVQPDEIINLGDTVDLAGLSRFKPDSDHFHRTLGPAFQRVHDMYAEYRADNPHAKIVEVDSNHNTRLRDFILKNMPQLYGVRQAGSGEEEYPVMTYPYLANLGHLGVEWISGYGAAEYIYGEEYGKPPIVFMHGKTMVSGGSTALKESRDNAENHIVRGHGHRIEQHTRTNRAGQYLSSIMLGALCRIDGVVPGYHSAVNDRNEVVKKVQNWQNSVLVVNDYGGDYEFRTIQIRDGLAYFDGKLYNGEEI